MLDFVLGFFKWVLIIFSPFILSTFFFFLYYYFKGHRFKKGQYKFVSYGSKFKRIFFDFPKRFVLDRYNNDPDCFKEYGVHIIAGEQGSGKSIALTYILLRLQKMYPKMIVKTNYGYTHEVSQITHWKDIVASSNGIYGEIDVLDEIQNWFSSVDSRNFPPEMLTEVTQQRKQRKIIIGTSQVFTRVAKPIREQTTFLYEPITIFGCLTIVRVYRPKLNQDGLTDKKMLRQIFFFVHSDEVRNSFDTYKKIEKYAKKGFSPNPLTN